MLFYVFYNLLHDLRVLFLVLRVARLNESVLGHNIRILIHIVLAIPYNLQLACSFNFEFRFADKLKLWRESDEELTLWQLMRAVGLHAHIFAEVIQLPDELLIDKQSRFSSCQYDHI